MKKNLILSLFILSVSTSYAAVNPDCDQDSHYPLITTSELQKLVKERETPNKDQKELVLVDVNNDERYKKGHVPGAIHFKKHQKDFAAQLPKDTNTMIVAYCGGPSCSAWKKAAKEACKMGYTNVRHFKDGITGWEKNI